jgi:glucan phosphoethanolaminetransferase (alkaline phosphatase superfamily)
MLGQSNDQLTSLVSLIIIFVINGSILYYLKHINQQGCNCTIDWRYKYITMYAVALMSFNVYIFLSNPSYNCHSTAIIYTMLFLGNLVYFYALYTYIEQLDKENCICATEKNKTIHNILYYYRYVFVLYVILSILLIFKAFKFAACINYVSSKAFEKVKKGKKLKKNHK